jgi:glycosyltransferase involved in cell wall biosynthesis
MTDSLQVSLVIPVFNEGKTIEALIQSINKQTRFPDEIVFVDGGSTDNTVQLIKDICKTAAHYKVIGAGRAMPGKGRNIGTEAALFPWIAYTDAGIILDKDWLSSLVQCAETNKEASIIYGNFSPQINSFFEKAATVTYVAPQQPGKIRGRSIASCLLKKEVWEKAGGFPDWRATEDLVFMENAEKAGYKIAEVPGAKIFWQLRPDIKSTFKKFDLYSKYNVWAGRQAYWHYGVAKQYVIVLVFILLAIFHHWLWFLMIPIWLIARTAKRILLHRNEFGAGSLFSPLFFLMVMLLILVIDAATFTGWVKAIFQKNKF